MHPQKKLEEKLSQLKNILAKMKALLEWQKLKLFEKSYNLSTRLFFSDDTSQQLLNYSSHFLSTSAEINQLLNIKYPSMRGSPLAQEFYKLCARFYYLGTDIRVY